MSHSGPRPDSRPAHRPLSPHLQIWRWHVTMLASILHRMSGAALYGGLVLVVVWLACLAAGPEVYGVFAAVSGSVFGLIIWFLLTLALAYHLMSGIRHLIWDTGRGLEPRTASLLSTASIIAGLVLAAAFFAVLIAEGRVSL